MFGQDSSDVASRRVTRSTGAAGRTRHRPSGRAGLRAYTAAADWTTAATRPRVLPVSFRFVFEGGASVPRWVVTEVGVGERVDDDAEASAKPQGKRSSGRTTAPR